MEKGRKERFTTRDERKGGREGGREGGGEVVE